MSETTTATKPAAAKAPAKKDAPKFVYVAMGRCGKEARRTSDKVFSYAVDLADPDATREDDKVGKVVRFFPSKDAADAWAATQREAGYNAKVVPAKPAS